METKILVSNIQRFCLNDGPGIRTTVFLKGCNLHCPWCANPENISFEPQQCFARKESKEPKSVYGKWISLQNIYEEVMKDKLYYKNGGVTFSGGEPLLAMSKLKPLLKRLCQEKISICAETALFVPEEELQIALKYLDTLIVDIKILEEEKCKNIHGGTLKTYLRNINILNNADIDVIYRIPLIKPYTTEAENINRIVDFLQSKRYLAVELIKGHNLAEKKYQSLDKEWYRVPELSDEELCTIKSKFLQNGISAEICKI